MNFKRNCFAISLLACLTMLVTSCGANGNFKPCKLKSDYFEITEITEGNYTRAKEYKAYEAKTTASTVTLGSANEVMRKYGAKKILNSTGDQKLLVIPVEFKDYPVSKTGSTRSKFVDDLECAFFGDASCNTYLSVAEYFNISSYGRLRLSGKVCDKFYTFSKSVEDINKLDEEAARTLVANEYSKILNWYSSYYLDMDSFAIPELSTGDKNPNTRKDIPIYLIYTMPSELKEGSNGFFWAYTFVDVPVSWTSFTNIYSEFHEPDSHTLIHETGHLLGLVDYYPTADDAEKTNNIMPEPTARLDMMDCSIGDETAFSKMYLNWTTPYHVHDTTSISMKPFEDSGDLILLNDSWDGTVFDEYYVLEFYTPTMLNTYDSAVGNSDGKLPVLPGVKLYHVDARLGYFNRTHTFLSYCKEGKDTLTNNTVDYAHNNYTYFESTSAAKRNYLYELVLNRSDVRISGAANDAHLYHGGDVIEGLKSNSFGDLNYKITIDSVTYKEAKISIEKVA